jgi:hypothetical protein
MVFARLASPVTLTAGKWYFLGVSRRGDGDTAAFTVIRPSSSTDAVFVTLPGDTPRIKVGYAHETLSVGDTPDLYDTSSPFLVGPLA